MADYMTKLVRGYYYTLLNIDEQMIYKKIGVAVANMEENIRIRQIQMKELRKISMAIAYDNPELFYWSPNETKLQNGVLYLQYSAKREEVTEMLETIREECQKIIGHCRSEGEVSPIEVLGAVYDYFRENISYAHMELEEEEQPKWLYGMEGVFLYKKSACLGIAQAINYICQGLKIPHMIVTGEGTLGDVSMNHAWNLVNVEGRYKHFDVTSDIYEGNQGERKYFLCGDEDMKNYHWSKETYPPTKE